MKILGKMFLYRVARSQYIRASIAMEALPSVDRIQTMEYRRHSHLTAFNLWVLLLCARARVSNNFTLAQDLCDHTEHRTHDAADLYAWKDQWIPEDENKVYVVMSISACNVGAEVDAASCSSLSAGMS